MCEPVSDALKGAPAKRLRIIVFVQERSDKMKENEEEIKTVVFEPNMTIEDLENDEGIQYCVGPSENGKGIIISVYSKDNCIRLNNKNDLQNLISALIDMLPMEE